MAALPQLTDLGISLHAEANGDQAPFALQLPAVRSLRLSRLRLPSLRFLQHSPTLSHLSLAWCRETNADELLISLQSHAPQLRRLDLFHSVELSIEQYSLLRQPSTLTPTLNEFTCRSHCMCT